MSTQLQPLDVGIAHRSKESEDLATAFVSVLWSTNATLHMVVTSLPSSYASWHDNAIRLMTQAVNTVRYRFFAAVVSHLN